jgi:TonB family protein
MPDDRKHSYLEKGYLARMQISFALAVVLLIAVLALLPPADQLAPRPRVKNVIIDLYNLSLDESSANGGGGGGGGSSAPAQEPAQIERLRFAIPKPVPAAPVDTSQAVVQSAGTGEGSGIGDGQGSGIGSGQGDGIGDGVGSGRGKAAPDTVPPRPLVQVMAEQPRSGPDKNAVGLVRLRVKVNERGQVDEVQVLLNSTGSPVCEQKAIAAARHSRYQPARVQSVPVASWTVCEFGFNQNIGR